MLRSVVIGASGRAAAATIACSLLLVVAGCGGHSIATDDLTSPCPQGSQSSAKSMGIQSPKVNIRTGPGTSFDRVVDQPRSRQAGTLQYANLGAQFTVLEECRKDGWSRIWVTEPKRLRATHHGWVASRFLTEISASASKARALRKG